MVSDLKSVEESQYEQALNIIFVFHFKSYLFCIFTFRVVPTDFCSFYGITDIRGPKGRNAYLFFVFIFSAILISSILTYVKIKLRKCCV